MNLDSYKFETVDFRKIRGGIGMMAWGVFSIAFSAIGAIVQFVAAVLVIACAIKYLKKK